MGTIYHRKDGYWYYQYYGYDKNGYKKRYGISLGKVDEADLPELLKKYDDIYDNPSRQQIVKQQVPLQSSINTYLQHRQQQVNRGNRSPSTFHSDQTALKLFRRFVYDEYGVIMVNDVNRVHLEAFKNFRLNHVSVTTIASNLRHISTFFTWLVDTDHILNNPFAGRKKIKIPKSNSREDIPNQQEWKKLKKYLQTYIDDWIANREPYVWFLAMIFIQLNMGLRIGEASTIKWKQGEQDYGKGHSRSYVYLSDDLTKITIYFKRGRRVLPLTKSIQRVFHHIPRETIRGRKVKPKSLRVQQHIYVFENPYSGKAPLTNSISRMFTKLLINAGIPSKYTTHSLRHGFCVECIRKNINLFKISKYVGHRVSSMTEMYSDHLSVKDFEDIGEQIMNG